MTPNLRPFDRAVRLVLGAVALVVAFALFRHPLAVILAAFFAIFSFGECVTGVCHLYRVLGVPSEKDRLTREHTYLLGLAAIQLVIAYEWLVAGWEKLSSGGEFVKNITAILTTFASKNPYPWYKEFLLNTVMPDAPLYGYLIEWSQVVIGGGLVLATALFVFVRSESWRRAVLICSVIALFGGLLMNLNFYLAAGWTHLGTRGSNVLMFWIQAALLFAWAYRLLIAKPSPMKAK